MSWHSDDPEPFEGELTSVTITRTVITHPPQDVDKRYRILVLLQRSDRPKYWTFKCNHCGYDVQDLTNVEVEAVSDLVELPGNDVLIGRRCGGPYCKYHYYFKLSGVSK